MNGSGVCSNCKERGHNAEKCPELWSPLKDGFYTGGGGGGGGGSDDDEQAVVSSVFTSYPRRYYIEKPKITHERTASENNMHRNRLFPIISTPHSGCDDLETECLELGFAPSTVIG